MDKPVCRLCGEKHWASEPHVFEPFLGTSSALPVAGTSGGRSRDIGRRRKTVKSTTVGGVVPAGSSEGTTGELERLRAMVEGRRTYMREYMRKRRSKR